MFNVKCVKTIHDLHTGLLRAGVVCITVMMRTSSRTVSCRTGLERSSWRDSLVLVKQVNTLNKSTQSITQLSKKTFYSDAMKEPCLFQHRTSQSVVVLFIVENYCFSSMTYFPGIPQSFQTIAEMCKFVTMVVFTCSALHSAVNFSQACSMFMNSIISL